MTLQELNKNISSGVLSPFYVFFGVECGIMDIYINKIVEQSKKEPLRVDCLADVFQSLKTGSLFGGGFCYIIRDDKQILQASEGLLDSLVSGDALGDNMLILVYTDLDKRGKFYKRQNENITEFERLDENTLLRIIGDSIDITEEHKKTLIKRCNNDYSRILLETDKVLTLSDALNISENKAFEMAIHDGLIYESPQAVIFDLIDAVCRRQPVNSFHSWEKLKRVDNSPLPVLALLYNNFRAMMLVNAAEDGDISKRTGLTGFQVKIAKEKGHNYKIKELVNIVKTIRNTEKQLKTGLISADICIDLLICQILEGAKNENL